MSNEDEVNPSEIPQRAERVLGVIGSLLTNKVNRVGLLRVQHDEHPDLFQTALILVRKDGGMMPLAIIPDDEDLAFGSWHPVPQPNGGISTVSLETVMEDVVDWLGLDSIMELATLGPAEPMSAPDQDDDDEPQGCGDPDCPGCGDSELAEQRRAEMQKQAETMAGVIQKMMRGQQGLN